MKFTTLWMLALRPRKCGKELNQIEKLVNGSRAKKLKSLMIFGSVAHTGSSFRNTSSYLVTRSMFVVNYGRCHCLGSNAQNETRNVQRTLRTSSLRNTSTIQCYNCSGKGHYARNCPKPRVRDLRMEEIEELSANICLMARIKLADNTSDAGPSYDSAFISTLRCDQIDSNIIFDEPNGHVNSGSVEKDTHVPDLYAFRAT
ncbi:integrase, catalytic region, zinc finger, CCHC-type containing protein [Tanacetum coccineum]